MKYGNVNGPVYCRFAGTPPVVNSMRAFEYGIEARVGPRSQYGLQPKQGRNVKLRLILDDRTRRMTCHGKIDWIKEDGASGELRLGLGMLSLTEEEFDVLLDSFVSEPSERLTFGDTVRVGVDATEPVVTGFDSQIIRRKKVVTMPVALIEDIDARRGETSFSDYVVAAVSTYLDRR